MGQFLAIAGIAGASKAEVEKALQQYAIEKGKQVGPAASGDPDHTLLWVSESPGNKISVLFPASFFEWDHASAYLSVVLKQPVFSFHIHDGDLWMYVLYFNGQPVDQFNPIPAYWDDGIPPEEIEKWKGRASTVCEFWPDLDCQKIEPYLVCWNLDEVFATKRKACPEDEFHYGEDWQLVDFMKKLGLAYPVDSEGNYKGDKFRFFFEK